MLSKNKQKYIRSLSLKKFRDAEDAFIAEGPKVVEDLSGAFRCRMLCATAGYLAAHRDLRADEVTEVTQEELQKCSLMHMPQQCLAVFGRQREADPHYGHGEEGLVLALDDIQDPGNLGTIIRTCDWFGVRKIVCSRATADAFQPKVVQATMGALARVRVDYTDLPAFLAARPEGTAVYGTFLDGENIYGAPLEPAGSIIVMGNEGHGISADVAACVDSRLLIPSYPSGIPTSESLNVGIATALTLAEFRRRMI